MRKTNCDIDYLKELKHQHAFLSYIAQADLPALQAYQADWHQFLYDRGMLMLVELNKDSTEQQCAKALSQLLDVYKNDGYGNAFIEAVRASLYDIVTYYEAFDEPKREPLKAADLSPLVLSKPVKETPRAEMSAFAAAVEQARNRAERPVLVANPHERLSPPPFETKTKPHPPPRGFVNLASSFMTITTLTLGAAVATDITVNGAEDSFTAHTLNALTAPTAQP